MLLACTYAYNVGTMKERIEANTFIALLALFGPKMIAPLVVRPSKPKPTGVVGLTKEQADWLRALMGTNRSGPMRGAVRGMITFDSRPWLKEITPPTLVIAATNDAAVPRYHFDMLVNGIPGAAGRLVDRADHALISTHTRQLADIICAEWQ
jgi:pimeloyl-ACP methyl ester carboxylesterase